MLNRSKHEVVMRDVLLRLYGHPSLARSLVFKGGTACYFFFDLTRFSTDLDFNLIANSPEPVFSEMKTLLESQGRVKDAWIKKNTIFFLFEHTPKFSAIKIEVSTREREKMYDSQLLAYYGATIRVMTQPCLFTSKLIALTSRPAPTPRDLYDVHFFLTKHWDIDKASLEQLTSQTLIEYLDSLPEFIKKSFTPKSISEGLNHLLLNEADRSFVKKDLITSTIQQLQIYRDSLTLV